MKAILVANPKGGAGKTTLAVNLAGALALRKEKVFLWDLDRQKSTRDWLAIRGAEYPPIHRLDSAAGDDPALPHGSKWLILDSPAGLHGKNLVHALKVVQKVLIPVQPSIFDMAATRTFLEELLSEKSVRRHKTFIGIVGMRVDARTRAAATLEAFLAQFELPVVANLRDTQIYANAAFGGKSIFDLPTYAGGQDVEQWKPILDWVLDEN
ncbi:MAG: AAA family ATPase [Burkholderiales bacterium]